jgi:hypothetical protein
MKKFNVPIDPLGQEVLSFLEHKEGIRQTPNVKAKQKDGESNYILNLVQR